MAAVSSERLALVLLNCLERCGCDHYFGASESESNANPRRSMSEYVHLELLSLGKEQFGLRMQVATQQLSNTSQLTKVRRNIARVKTVLTEKGVQQ